MAKQASKPASRSGGRAAERTKGPAKATARPKTASSARGKTTSTAERKAKPAPSRKAAPSSRSIATSEPSAATSGRSAAKGTKLQAAGKAITSGHAPAKTARKASSSPPVQVKQAAGKRAATGTSKTRPSAERTPPKRPKPARRVAFDRKTLNGIKKALEDQRKGLLEQLEEIEEAAFSPSQVEAASEAGFDDDYADAGTATFEREKDLSIANNINSLVDKIDKALEKIEHGSYGICENCGQPISADRLKALPHVLLCINCKKAEERR